MDFSNDHFADDDAAHDMFMSTGEPPMGGFSMADNSIDSFLGSWSMAPLSLPSHHSGAQPRSTESRKDTNKPNRRFTAAEWDQQRTLIETLYVGERRTLSYVRNELSRYGFDATLKQLKTKIKDWGFDTKNIKTDKMMVIARTRAKRKLVDGKDSTFRVCGVAVDEEKIERFMKRKKLSVAQLIAAPSPMNAPSPAFSVFTPHPNTPGTERNGESEHYMASSYLEPIDENTMDCSSQLEMDDVNLVKSAERVSLEQAGEHSTDVSDSTPELEDVIFVKSIDHVSDNIFDLNYLDTTDGSIRIPDDPPYPARGSFKAEEDHCRAELTGCEMANGPQHPRTWGALERLGFCLERQGRYKAAEKQFRQLVGLVQEAMGDDSTTTISAFFHLSRIYLRQGRYVTAENLDRQILRALAKHNPNIEQDIILSIRSRLAVSLFSQGRYDEAAALQGEILDAHQKLNGIDHPLTLVSMAQLARTMKQRGFLSNASKVQREILDTQIRTSGPEHPTTIRTGLELAMSLAEEGRYSESEPLFKTGIEISIRNLGSEHPDTLRAEEALGYGLAKQKRLSEAETIFQRVWNMRKKILGESQLETLTTGLQLADCLELQGRHEHAEEIFKEIANVRERVFGKEHWKTLHGWWHVAESKLKQGRFAEAEQLHRDVLTKRRKTLGETHSKTFASELQVAVSIYSQGRFDKAEMIIREIITRSTKILGCDNFIPLRAMFYLSVVQTNQDRLHEAYHLLRDTLEKMKQFLGALDADTRNCAQMLALCEKKLEAKARQRVDHARNGITGPMVIVLDD